MKIKPVPAEWNYCVPRGRIVVARAPSRFFGYWIPIIQNASVAAATAEPSKWPSGVHSPQEVLRWKGQGVHRVPPSVPVSSAFPRIFVGAVAVSPLSVYQLRSFSRCIKSADGTLLSLLLHSPLSPLGRFFGPLIIFFNFFFGKKTFSRPTPLGCYFL